MKNAGCVSIFIGLESGSQKTLDSINKGIKLSDFFITLKKIKEQGISIITNFILGLPGETREDIKKSIEISLALPIDFASFNIFTPFPGSEFYKTLSVSNTINLKTHDWERYATQTGSYQLNQPSIRNIDIILLHKFAFLRFYLRRNYFHKIFQIVNIKALYFLLINIISKNNFADPYKN
jgi:anaerobic magnesium-protoporphyrin IX monomethyl ester cyclase